MYPAIIFVLVSFGLLGWYGKDRKIRSLTAECERVRNELFQNAEGEIERLAALSETINHLRDRNSELEEYLAQKSKQIRLERAELDIARSENEVLCMKLARAVWQNSAAEERNPKRSATEEHACDGYSG